MERFGQKLEEIKQKQKRSHENSQAKIESSTAIKKSPYILALGGMVSGLVIAVILLLAKIIVDKNNTNTIAPKTAETIHAIEIKKLGDDVALLDERVKLVTESISSMESMLMRILELTDSISDIEKKHTSSSGQYRPESADAVSAFDDKKPDASKVLHVTPEAVTVMVPTHVIKTRLNLRPSSSLNTTPIEPQAFFIIKHHANRRAGSRISG
jgi:hypothetical protein